MKDILYRLITRYMAHMGLILHFDMGDDAPAAAPAPDTSALIAAGNHAADVGKQLGDAQLAESRRQYDANMAVSKPIVEAQTGLMKQSMAQGDDYYNYMVANQRPVEMALNEQAMKDGSAAAQEEAAGTAMADVRTGNTAAINAAIRQGLRYGYAPGKMTASVGGTAAGQASALAAAAGGAREKSKSLGWARKMDVAGMYRGLSGASTAAYGAASNAGNSAVGNQMQPGAALLTGMNQGAGTTMAGQGLRMGGYSGALNSATSAAASTNSYNASAGGGGGGVGEIIGAGLGAWAKTGFAGLS